MDFSEIIKQRRLELNLTLDEIAQYIGVNKSTVQGWESGRINNPRRDRIAKLAAILQLPPMYLVDEKGTVEINQGEIIENPVIPLPSNPAPELTPSEQSLLSSYRSLNKAGQEKLLDYARDLTESIRYTQDTPSQASSIS
jgi:transcriptional regulator with XRE-family HTH domain